MRILTAAAARRSAAPARYQHSYCAKLLPAKHQSAITTVSTYIPGIVSINIITLISINSPHKLLIYASIMSICDTGSTRTGTSWYT